MSKSQVVIVGGGISGLAAAYFLSKRGMRATLIEKAGRLGGLIRTDHVDGCDLEAGPDSFLATKPEMRELARELGIEDQIIPSNDDHRRVFIARHGALTPMPPGMIMLAPSDLRAALRSSFFSLPTKVRFVGEWFSKPKHRHEDVSVGQFVCDHFNEELFETIAEPLLTGVYGGNARDLSMESVLPRFLTYEQQYGSIVRGVQKERTRRKPGSSLFQSFTGGMETVLTALKNSLGQSIDVHSTEATQVIRVDGKWRVLTSDGSRGADSVILATPAHEAARLIQFSVPEAYSVLTKISYSSAILVTTLFDRGSFTHPLNGFGFLIPQRERKTVAAGTWINTKFPSRIATDRVAVRSFIVANEADRLASAPDEDIVHATMNDLRQWMGPLPAPIRTIVTRWPRSMPQHTVGHTSRIEQLQQCLSSAPGLHLCGNAYAGIGLSDCVRSARQAAEKIYGS